MIKSMTGFGRSEKLINGRRISVEIKSVNHRYFEFSCRTTRGYSFLEDKLKKYELYYPYKYLPQKVTELGAGNVCGTLA